MSAVMDSSQPKSPGLDGVGHLSLVDSLSTDGFGLRSRLLTQSRSLGLLVFQLAQLLAVFLSLGADSTFAQLQLAATDATALLERAETTPLNLGPNRSVKRIERDRDGAVTHLRADGMSLSPADLAAIASMPSLRSLVLAGTNIRDEDLAHLAHLKNLKHVNLNQTGISDRAFEQPAKSDSLKTLCLGNVRVSPERIREFIRDRKVSVGDLPVRVDQSPAATTSDKTKGTSPDPSR